MNTDNLEGIGINDMVIGIQGPPQGGSAIVSPTEASIREATRILAAPHTHSFTYALNANHTALRGCTCGLSFVGYMVGVQPGELRWHRVKEEYEG